MRESIVTVILGVMVLIFASTTFIYKHQLGLLKNQISTIHQRLKRDVMVDASDGEYVPLYTQLSAKSIQRICSRQWRIAKNRTKMKDTKKRPSNRKHSNPPQISKINVQPSWKRPYNIGSASNCDNNWLLTEFSNGYSLFNYHIYDQSTSIYTLPEEFEGTDFTAYCDQENKYFIYYSPNYGWNSGSIVKFDLKTRKHQRTVLIASNNPMYNGSSIVDLEVDDNFVWALYHIPSNQKLVVNKFTLESLKQAEEWTLDDSRLANASNCFISYSILYCVNFDSISGMQQIEAIYNLDTNKYISGDMKLKWKSKNQTLQNLHYYQQQDSLDVFDNGFIYTIKLHRN